MTDLDAAQGEMTRIAVRAGVLLQEGLCADKRVSHKGDVDLVTVYDLRSEELIRQALAQSFPGVAILAEEGGGPSSSAAARFIVDPLDGTTNFAHSHPVFCVSMALEIAGVISVGVVHAPALRWTATARLGGGAHRGDRQLSASTQNHLDGALLATGFPYNRRVTDDDNTREHRAFMKRAQGIRRMGSAAIDLALVAEGIYDGYWEMGLAPWDMAAGMLLVTEAGGLVTGYEGHPPVLEQGRVVACGAAIHDEMLRVLAVCRGATEAEIDGSLRVELP